MEKTKLKASILLELIIAIAILSISLVSIFNLITVITKSDDYESEIRLLENFANDYIVKTKAGGEFYRLTEEESKIFEVTNVEKRVKDDLVDVKSTFKIISSEREISYEYTIKKN